MLNTLILLFNQTVSIRLDKTPNCSNILDIQREVINLHETTMEGKLQTCTIHTHAL
jgi:hypothetical protein